MTGEMLSLSHVLYFACGVAAPFVVVLTYSWLKSRERPRSASQSKPSREANGQGERLHRCEYHQVDFYDADEARKHAIEYHNAPKEGDAWKATYGNSHQ